MASNNVFNKLKKMSDEERSEMKEKFADVSMPFNSSIFFCFNYFDDFYYDFFVVFAQVGCINTFGWQVFFCGVVVVVYYKFKLCRVYFEETTSTSLAP